MITSFSPWLSWASWSLYLHWFLGGRGAWGGTGGWSQTTLTTGSRFYDDSLLLLLCPLFCKISLPDSFPRSIELLPNCIQLHLRYRHCKPLFKSYIRVINRSHSTVIALSVTDHALWNGVVLLYIGVQKLFSPIPN